jgi:hypothetical protein
MATISSIPESREAQPKTSCASSYYEIRSFSSSICSKSFTSLPETSNRIAITTTLSSYSSLGLEQYIYRQYLQYKTNCSACVDCAVNSLIQESTHIQRLKHDVNTVAGRGR